MSFSVYVETDRQPDRHNDRQRIVICNVSGNEFGDISSPMFFFHRYIDMNRNATWYGRVMALLLSSDISNVHFAKTFGTCHSFSLFDR